ncbi:SGNH/GDSL hydrolase family protein [Bacillus sp. F19]|nr:SGNH/GDSL hydrolase family protein [Bacillus sp. F19]
MPITAESQEYFLLPLKNALNEAIESAAQLNGDTYVPTRERVDPSNQKYMINPEDNHLNVRGYKAIAKEFWKAIKEND